MRSGVIVVVLTAAAAGGGGRAPDARWVERSPGDWIVAIDGVPGPGCPDGFVVRTVPAAPTTPPMAGRCAAAATGVIFEPAFPIAAGVAYEISLPRRPAVRFELPSLRPASTTTVRLFPSASTLPENQLKLYLEFSAPMSTGGARHHLHLLDETGREVPGAFLAGDQEMWNSDRHRLTMLFDPGRIKRGLRANVELGAPLTAGRRFSIVVDRHWLDGRGAPLAHGLVKRFDVVGADRTRPDPAGWRVEPPLAGGPGAVRVHFPEAMDYALARTSLRVLDAAGAPVDGSIAIEDDERAWRFVPATPWRPQPYTIEIDAAFEDLAGNNLRRVFDLDLRRDVAADGRPARLSFTPRIGS